MKIKLEFKKIKERGEGLYLSQDKKSLEVRKGAELFFEAHGGAIVLKIDYSYKDDKDLERAKNKKIYLIIKDDK